MPDNFRDRILGERPAETDYEKTLRLLAEEYVERTEAYDQVVCSGRRDGIAIPVSGDESSLINRHARKVMTDLCERTGFSRAELRSAIRDNERRNR